MEMDNEFQTNQKKMCKRDRNSSLSILNQKQAGKIDLERKKLEQKKIEQNFEFKKLN